MSHRLSQLPVSVRCSGQAVAILSVPFCGSIDRLRAHTGQTPEAAGQSIDPIDRCTGCNTDQTEPGFPVGNAHPPDYMICIFVKDFIEPRDGFIVARHGVGAGARAVAAAEDDLRQRSLRARAERGEFLFFTDPYPVF